MQAIVNRFQAELGAGVVDSPKLIQYLEEVAQAKLAQPTVRAPLQETDPLDASNRIDLILADGSRVALLTSAEAAAFPNLGCIELEIDTDLKAGCYYAEDTAMIAQRRVRTLQEFYDII